MNETEEKNTEESSANTDTKESYHILTFAKEHPASFVAILSSAVAAAAFIMNLLTFIYQLLRLRPWHVSGQFISDGGGRQIFFQFALVLIYYAFVNGIPLLLSCSFVRYYRFGAKLRYRQEWYRLVKQMYREFKTYKATLSKEELHSTEAALAKIRKSGGKLRRNMWSTRGFLLLNMGAICFFAALMFFPITLLIAGITGEVDWRVISALWGATAVLIVFSAKSEAKGMDCGYAPRTVRRNVRDLAKSNDAMDQLESAAETAGEEAGKSVPIASMLHDKAIKEAGLKILLSVAIMTTFLFLTATDTTYKQKEFWMYLDSGYVYAVAYQDIDHCILKRATVDGDTIIIHTGEQLVINGTVSTYRQDFEHVSFEDEPG